MPLSKYSRDVPDPRERDAKIVWRLRNSVVTLEALGAEYGLTRQCVQQIAKRAGITWETRRRVFPGQFPVRSPRERP